MLSTDADIDVEKEELRKKKVNTVEDDEEHSLSAAGGDSMSTLGPTAFAQMQHEIEEIKSKVTEVRQSFFLSLDQSAEAMVGDNKSRGSSMMGLAARGSSVLSTLDGRRSSVLSKWSSQQSYYADLGVDEAELADGMDEDLQYLEEVYPTKLHWVVFFSYFSYTLLFFSATMAFNITFLVYAEVGGGGIVAEYCRNNVLAVALYNVIACMVVRNEVIHYLLTNALLAIGMRLPLFLKSICVGTILHLGGIHSGCGVGSLCWLIYGAYLQSQEEYASELLRGCTFACCAFLGTAIIAAFPLVRFFFHNQFEMGHRFFGWTALGLLWCITFFTYSYSVTVDPRTGAVETKWELRSSDMMSHPEIYCVVIATMIVIFPWLETHKIQVRVETPSDKIAIVKMDGNVPSGRFGRLSTDPLFEWHAFAISSYGKASGEHFMVVASAGNWTKALHTNKPTELWTRKFKFTGLPRMVHMYKNALIVCTGAGVSVPVSALLQDEGSDASGYKWRLLWIASSIKETYGAEFVDELIGTGRVIVYDTHVHGRPNVTHLTLAMYQKYESDAVLITSNPNVTRNLVTSLKMRGIQAYGPVFDS